MRHEIEKWSGLRTWLYSVARDPSAAIHLESWQVEMLLRLPHPLVDEFPIRAFVCGPRVYLELLDAVPPHLKAYAERRVARLLDHFAIAREIVLVARLVPPL